MKDQTLASGHKVCTNVRTEANFSPCFSFLSLTCHRVIFFALRYFVNYVPLLRAVCKFSEVVCCLAPFYQGFFVPIRSKYIYSISCSI